MLFPVTEETFEDRIKRIRKLAKTEPILAFLIAVFNFEWTVRRAILAMSPCPTKTIREYMFKEKIHGWDTYRDTWKVFVKVFSLGNRVIPSLSQILREGTQTGIPKNYFDNLKDYLKERHKLVHGVKGFADVQKIDDGLEVVLKASEIITGYVKKM